jgi:molybdopterin converting factor small subunit
MAEHNLTQAEQDIEALGAAPDWVLRGLKPAPESEWDRLLTFLNLDGGDRRAMRQTVEPLFRRGYELVVSNYDYLLQNPETAAILGWEKGADPEHLAERRQFFTIWLARTLGLDFSHDFALYLFLAGKLHAGHGPRQVHVPEVYVTGAVSLVTATFARFLQEELPGAEVVPAAIAAWNKYLTLHLHMMLLGYQAALDLDRGEMAIPVSFFGRLRELIGGTGLTLHLESNQSVADGLHKLFNYSPALREAVFETAWEDDYRLDTSGTPWLVVQPAYRIRQGWRLLVNGREVHYRGGLETQLQEGDELQIFPPGR